MRVSILWICLALVLSAPAFAVTSVESAPDWLELLNSLNEIGEGLQMTDAPLTSIESSLAERELGLQTKEQELNATELRLQKREQGLNEREQGLIVRERGIADIQDSLDLANKKLKRGWIWLGLAVLAGGVAGYALH